MSEASRLQRSPMTMRMKWMTVGLLAMVGLSACGVGVDDPEGQGVVGAGQQAVYVGPDGTVVAYQGQTPAQTTAALTGPNGGQNELPQDPVPAHGPNGPNTRVVVVPVPMMK
jgi:hypothetical protein